jgi:lon-related putative ATP-dependent protease
MARRLKAEELRAVCDPATLGFRSTAELAPLEDMMGQDRALAAATFGIGMRHVGYNLFVLGPSATGKTTAMQRVLTLAAAHEPPGADYCYVHSFVDPYRPTALALPAGRGRELRDAMARLVEEVKTRLPRTFESEEFARRKAEILDTLNQRQEEEVRALEAAANRAGFVVLRTHGGLAVAPAPLGKPLSREQFDELPAAVRDKIAAGAATLEEQVESTLRRVRDVERQAREAHERLVREAAAAATRQLIQEVRDAFAGLADVAGYLDGVEQDLIEHAEEVRTRDEKPALPFAMPANGFLDRYRVNVLIDRGGATGAPVVLEANPTHGNLLGRIEHRVHFGALVTDFTQIKPGALHQANGGYLILEVKDVLQNFLAWDALKKALKNRSIRIQEPLEELRLVSAASLAPEPIPLAVKVVLIGTPLHYYLLWALDEDFRELFKVKVDFDDSLPRTDATERLFARFVATSCAEDGLAHFAADGVARLVEESSRLVAHQGRLSSRLGLLRDVIREAAFFAGARPATLVAADDVDRAIAQRVYRANLLEERVDRMIEEDAILIATGGDVVGQVNGISVLALGDHAFGRPSRITARAFSGQPGVVDIEREAKLGGRIHSKGVMILTGFLAGRYARERPLAVSASIAFEQSYEEVEGDSASSAELYALLSSLAGVPLSQSLAVTGSVNQLGEIQAVGGINEKVEGFFDVCQARGLTGGQGVLIPEANVRHLMLRPDVVQAVRQERFNIWAVGTVDDGLALLTGREAGQPGRDGRFAEGTVNAAVEAALAANVERLREFRAGRADFVVGGPDMAPQAPPRSPRPG